MDLYETNPAGGTPIGSVSGLGLGLCAHNSPSNSANSANSAMKSVSSCPDCRSFFSGISESPGSNDDDSGCRCTV